MIYVVARSAESGAIFLDRHNSFREKIEVLTGQTSYFDVINHVIDSCPDGYCVIVHDDVFLRSGFVEELPNLIEELDRDWPNWGLVGNAGIAPFGVGYSGERIIRYLSDPHGGPNMTESVVPAETLDGNLLLLNIASLRRKSVRVPDFLGFQMYDIIFSIEVIVAGLAVLVAPELACFHASAGSQSDFDVAALSDSARIHIASRLLNSRVLSLNGAIDLEDVTSKFVDHQRFELGLQSLRNAQVGRSNKSLTVATRTRFNRRGMLERCIETVAMFKDRSTSVDVSHVVVSSFESEDSLSRFHDVIFLRAPTYSLKDDRFRLVKWIANEVNSDYLLFLDDDDWLFPNAAEFISLLVALAPEGSSFFFDTRQFSESFTDDVSESLPALASPERKFEAKLFFGCYSGHNQIPFCGAILPRSAVSTIPDSLVESMTLFEDYATILHCMTRESFSPVVVDVLLAGISIHGEGQTVYSADRTRWNESMAVLAAEISRGVVGSRLNSLPQLALRHSGQDLRFVESMLNAARESHYHAIQDVNRMRATWSWRITRPFRVLFRAVVPSRLRRTQAPFATNVENDAHSPEFAKSMR